MDIFIEFMSMFVTMAVVFFLLIFAVEKLDGDDD